MRASVPDLVAAALGLPPRWLRTSRRRTASGRLTVAMLVLLLTGVLTPFVSTGTALAACSGPNYYGRAWSGNGGFYGTGAEIFTWSHWSVNGHYNGFSDEAVWVINYDNVYDAEEVGFFTGYGAGNYYGGSGFTNGMVPYYTFGNGQ